MGGERSDETIEIRREVLHRAAKKKNLCREDKRKTYDTTVSDVKNCWVCHSSENGDNSNAWINPCKCKGSVKWCHQACLRPWIQYKIDNRRAVQCDICNYRYKIRFPPTPANTIVCFVFFYAMYDFQYFILSKRMDSGVAFSYRDVLVWIVATFMVTGVIAMTMVFLGRAAEIWVRELKRKKKRMEIRAYEGC